ncbi:fibrous sheath-interacting protein 1 [Pleurodeles waltl]
MDIVKGSLDEISRPASISRSRSGSRASTASSSEKPKLNLVVGSLEVLPPEPSLSKVSPSLSENIWSSAESSFNSSCDEMDMSSQSSIRGSRGGTSPLQPAEGKVTDHSRRRTPSLQTSEGKESDHGRRGTPPLHPAEGKETGHGRIGTPPLQSSENIVNYVDHTTASPDQHSELNSKKASDAKPHEASDEENTDPQLAEAVRKMKTLDKILAKKQVREKEVKYLGQQMRKKLWEELQSATSPEAQESHEETLNTRKFLVLTPQVHDVTDADSLEEELTFTPVFHTQIPADEGDWTRAPNSLDSHHHRNDLNDMSHDSEKPPSVPRKRSRVKTNKRDFIKRNIELARDAGHPVVLMDDEKQRIEDLLKDVEDDAVDPEALVEVSRWVMPGEGYTPEPEEHKLLAKIDAELQAVLSAKEFAAIRSSCTSIQNTSNQDSSSLMSEIEDGELFESAEEVLPGELVLRLTKEERLQQARLRDIDHELETLGQSLNSPGPPGLSEQHLRALLSECWSQRGGSTVSLPVPEAQSPPMGGLDTPHASGTREEEEASGIGSPSRDGGDDGDSAQLGYYMAQALRVRQFSKPSFLAEPPTCPDADEEGGGETLEGPGGDDFELEDVAGD